MRCILLFAMLATLLPAADVAIDHVTVAGADVRKMQAALQAAGLPSFYGGAHTNGTTEMAMVSFPDGSYLELMGLQTKAGAQQIDQHAWGKLLRGDAGPCAWAVREKDIAAEVRRLQKAGITVGAPERSGRQRPDGVRLEWQTSDLGTGGRGMYFPFLIQDLTPREQRAFPQGKPMTTDFQGVSRVVIAVRDLPQAIRQYRQAYGLPEPVQQVDAAFGTRLARFQNMPVILAQPSTADSWLAKRIAQFGEAPCAFVLAAKRPEGYHATSTTRWFGTEISWFDAEKLGWRLGFEPAAR